MLTNNDLFSVENKRVLITGSSRGIGFTLAKSFALRGAIVILNGRHHNTLTLASEKLEALGCKVQTSVFLSILLLF